MGLAFPATKSFMFPASASFLDSFVDSSRAAAAVESVDDLIDGDDALVEVVFRRFQRRSTPRILRAVS